MDILYYIAIGLILAGGAILFIVSFLKMGQQQQIKMISEWLLLAVVQAEKELGSKTGEIKLRYVYDKFLQRFGIVAKLMPFEIFSSLVDVALDKMKDILSNNDQLAKYVNCECNKK